MHGRSIFACKLTAASGSVGGRYSFCFLFVQNYPVRQAKFVNANVPSTKSMRHSRMNIEILKMNQRKKEPREGHRSKQANTKERDHHETRVPGISRLVVV